MKKLNMIRKIFGTRGNKAGEAFPIDTLLKNPGYQLISRNIFKYLKLKDFDNCRLVSKLWKQFIDEDKYFGKIQLTDVMSLYSNGNFIQGFALFHFVCLKGSVRIVKLYLDNKKKMDIDVNAQDDNGWTPLHHATRYNNSLVVKQLLDHGVNVTLRTKNNGHIIHCAASNKDPKVIEAVFESQQLMNIDKNAIDYWHGETVLHFAAYNQHSHQPLAYLLQNANKFNLNINQLDNFQRSVFHSACGFGIEETVKFLIENAKKYNIDLNMRNNGGYTPFHYACRYGKFKIVEALLTNSKKYKINVIAVNNDGNDGQVIAEQKGRTDIVKLIKEWKRNQSKEVTSNIHDEILFQLKRIEQSGDGSIASHVIKLVQELKELQIEN